MLFYRLPYRLQLPFSEKTIHAQPRTRRLSRIRAAIIGTGGIAAAHVKGFEENADRAELVAAVDVDEAKAKAFCEDHGIAAHYGSQAACLAAESPDLVSICTPPGVHREQCVEALDAGSRVFCEKPLCTSLEEMEAIEAAEARTGLFCASVFQWRFGSAGVHLKQLLERGALGPPRVASLLTTWYRGADYYAAPWRGKWETESGGVSMIHGIHAMDFLLWLLGEWSEVRAMIGTLVHDIEVEDVSMANVRFANGAMAGIVNSVLSPREATYIRLDTEKATVEFNGLYGYNNDDWTFTTNNGLATEEEVASWQTMDEDRRGSHGTQLAHILDCMEAGRRPITSGPSVRGTIEFLAALYKSGMTGEPVPRGAIRPGDPFYHAMNGPGDPSWQGRISNS